MGERFWESERVAETSHATVVERVSATVELSCQRQTFFETFQSNLREIFRIQKSGWTVTPTVFPFVDSGLIATRFFDWTVQDIRGAWTFQVHIRKTFCTETHREGHATEGESESDATDRDRLDRERHIETCILTYLHLDERDRWRERAEIRAERFTREIFPFVDSCQISLEFFTRDLPQRERWESYVAYVYNGELVPLMGNQRVGIFPPKSEILFVLSLALIWCRNFQDRTIPVGGDTWPSFWRKEEE